MKASGDPNFPDTHWSLIARIRSSDQAEVARALDELCAQYHYPLYCYIRRRGLAHHDAQDALHDFLARLLRHGTLEEADADKGRLRSLLGTALSRFLINRHRDSERRGPPLVSLDETLITDAEARYQREQFTDHDTPERIFQRKWAHELMRLVLRRLRADYEQRGKLALYLALRPALINGGSLRGEIAPTLAAQLGVSEGSIRMAFHRLLDDYRAALESEVSQTVADQQEVEEEIAHLAQLLGR